MSAGERGRCRSCGAPILWAHTAAGKRIPLDAEPVRGLYTIVERPISGPGRADVPHAHAQTNVHQSHFATCPDSEKWRKATDPPAATREEVSDG